MMLIHRAVVRPIRIATLFALLLTTGSVTIAHAAPAAGGFQSDLDMSLGSAQDSLVALEDAMPQSKFTWRPGPGVRSVAEVYLHVAYANYRITALATGKEPPASAGWEADRAKWDAKTTDKAQIKKILEASFAHMRDAVKAVPDADLEKKIPFFGKEIPRRAALLQLLAHANEHLGQSIAYARMNKITPPWSKTDK
jgi:uncharacterized damage-inducible protein DinB